MVSQRPVVASEAPKLSSNAFEGGQLSIPVPVTFPMPGDVRSVQDSMMLKSDKDVVAAKSDAVNPRTSRAENQGFVITETFC